MGKYSGMILIFLVFAILISGCSKKNDDDKTTNTPPEIISVTPSTAFTNQTVVLTVQAEDADGDELRYNWVAEPGNGTLSVPTTLQTVMWTAPSTAGTYYVTVSVWDDEDTTTQTHAITVSRSGSQTEPTGSISGYIMDLGRDNLLKMLDAENVDAEELFSFVANATVSIREVDTLSVVTSSNGIYLFSGLPYGTYTISVTADNYHSKDSTIILSSRSRQVDFYLRSIIPNYRMDITPTFIDFGSSQTSAYIRINNAGRSNFQWRASEFESWMTISKSSGSLSAGGTDSIRVNISRSGLPAGIYGGSVFFTSAQAGNQEVELSFSVSDLSIVSVSIDETPLIAGAEYTVECSVNYIGTGELSYNWSSGGGIITPSGETSQDTAEWTTPTTPGNYSITLIVSDGEVADTLIRNFTVVEPTLRIDSLFVLSTPLGTDDMVMVLSSVYYNGPNPLSFGWEASEGVLDPADEIAFWTTPSSAGDYTISLIVSDGTIADTLSRIFTVEAEVITEEYDVQIISPSSGATVNMDSVMIQTRVTVVSGGTLPSRVNIIVDGDSIGVATDDDSDGIYEYDWNPTDSIMARTLVARAYHADGVTFDASPSVNVNTHYLQYSFTTPEEGDIIFPGDVVDVNIDITLLHGSYVIDGVEFFANDLSIGFGSPPDYSYSWDTSGFPSGNVEIGAVITITTPTGTKNISTSVVTCEIP